MAHLGLKAYRPTKNVDKTWAGYLLDFTCLRTALYYSPSPEPFSINATRLLSSLKKIWCKKKLVL